MSSHDDITIRRAQSPADYRALQAAQRLAWGIGDEDYVVPVATLAGANLHGGLVLGAFRSDGSAVGVSFAFLGKVEGRLCLYSQLTGVVPGFQNQGIGARLKYAQREFAWREGIATIAWTFDPLQAGNARFNLARLGAVGVRYYVDMYGPRTDALNLGAPTDRLLVEWAVAPQEPGPAPVVALAGVPGLIEIMPEGAPRFSGLPDPALAPRVRLEIPAATTRLRQGQPALAQAWSEAARAAFLRAFDAGFRATGFQRLGQGPDARCFYVLDRVSTP